MLLYAFLGIFIDHFSAAIAALYLTLLVSWSVVRSVGSSVGLQRVSWSVEYFKGGNNDHVSLYYAHYELNLENFVHDIHKKYKGQSNAMIFIEVT